MLKILILTMFSTGIAFADDYCNGYIEGYKSGYQKAVGIPGYDAMAPICHPRPIGQHEQSEQDHQNGYKQGYQKGYEKGKKDNVQ